MSGSRSSQKDSEGSPWKQLLPNSTLSGSTDPSYFDVQQYRKSCQPFTFLTFTHTVLPPPPCSLPDSPLPILARCSSIELSTIFICTSHAISLLHPGPSLPHRNIFPGYISIFFCLDAELGQGELKTSILSLLVAYLLCISVTSKAKWE